MKTLTIITTTYNRAYCLHQVYDSLVRQSCQDFIWLVIDDGSTDNTNELIKSYKDENKIEIEYYYKPNGGMHTARNEAYRRTHTEINTIIDSDDWVADGAIESIVNFWKENKRDDVAGIISLNANTKGEIIGSKTIPGLSECHYSDYRNKYNIHGDRKLIYRSDLSVLYPYPEFPGEKFYPPSYKFFMLDIDYKMLIMDKVTCIVNYNADSMTYNKYAQYKSCCKGFSHYRNEMIRISKTPKIIIKHMIHYIAESKMAQNPHYIVKCSKPIYALACYPLGILLYFYINNTSRKY